MSSLIKSLALLIAIVGLAFASYAGFVNGESRDNIPGSLSELGDLDSLDWVKVLRSECKNRYCEPDKAFELLKKLDKIYAALDDDAKTSRNEQKIVEQFEINQIDGDQFCAEDNLRQLAELVGCYHGIFLKKNDRTDTDYRECIASYLYEREKNFAFVCRSYVLKRLNKRVGNLDETDRHDMEQTLGNKLLLLKESNESFAEFFSRPSVFSSQWKSIKKISPKWMAILLEYLKDKSGNNLDAKCYITTGEEGKEKFNELFQDNVIDKCWRWRRAVVEAERFQLRDERQREDYTERQANWIKYADVCRDMTLYREFLAESLYSKLKSDWSMLP